jgi:hemoglobin
LAGLGDTNQGVPLGSWDVAGQGVDAESIRKAVGLFYERAMADPEAAALFDGVDMQDLRAHQRQFLLHILGGSDRYSSQDIKDAHGRFAIDDAMFDRMIGYLLSSLTAVGVAHDVVDRAGRDMEVLRALIVTGD